MSAVHSTSTPDIYGLLAEFDSPAALLEAAEKVTAGGYTRTDAFSPFPIHGLADAIGFKENKVAPIILGGGITGLLGGFGLQVLTVRSSPTRWTSLAARLIPGSRGFRPRSR